ncbi:MAG: hypothetical protein LJF06_04920 [Gemmatimonadetes bacterium]|nr:hypothetical protein [Gemmatimonadota bacterium]
MIEPEKGERSEDPGVPEALPRTLAGVRERLGAVAVDRLWIFPPRRRGRRESGLVAVSVFLEGEERRRLLTVAYTAERTGRSLTVEPVFTQEGEAPPELLPRVMEGVVQRAGQGHTDPREVHIGGDPTSFGALMEEFDPALLAAEQAKSA